MADTVLCADILSFFTESMWFTQALSGRELGWKQWMWPCWIPQALALLTFHLPLGSERQPAQA